MLKYYNLWVLGTIGLFYFGPIDWPGRSQPVVALVVLPCLLALNVGALAGWFVNGTPSTRLGRVQISRRTGYALALLFLVLTDVHLRRVTGTTLFDPRSFSFDFGDVYQNFLSTSYATGGRAASEVSLSILKGLLFLGVLIVASDAFPRRPLLLLVIAFALFASSMLRGTDKEFVDIFIIFSVLYFYKSQARISLRYPIIGLAIVLFFFLERRIGRYGGALPECIAGGEICLGYDTALSRYLSPSIELLAAFLTNYIVQGYEGLTLAYHLPFDWNYGIGHLPLLKRAICTATGVTCDIGDFQTKLIDVGWDTTYRWTSAYTIIANDLGWHLLPLYFAGIGFLLSVSERRWREQRDIVSLVVIVLITVFMVYSSANMQLSVGFDWLIATLILFPLQFLRAVRWHLEDRTSQPSAAGST